MPNRWSKIKDVPILKQVARHEDISCI